ncbi:MAG: ABC transporter substrate-binding protein [Candidatus Dormibacteraeota bacterium]|uniref:ABC transporter substrate-binding protein n=1 Tax=Candidatus Amunia macphersoniae TaxID=3127014 RepID=A0A934KJR9_9BACT|nr:ABC transporter substrate-binding protein [Candidatus Dormibacteraeota bacterium]
MKTSRRGVRPVAAAFIITAALSACGSTTSGGSSGTAATTRDIRLAIVGPMTGDAAADGQHILDGATLARDQINNAGGVASGLYKGAKIVLDPLDDTESVDRSVTLAHQVVDSSQEWAFLGTGFSDAAIATAPVLERASVSYLSTYASSAQILAKPFKNVFVVPPTFPAYAYSAAEVAYKQGYRHAAVLQANAAFGLQMAKLFTDHFTALGGMVVDTETYTLGDKNTQGFVAKALASQPEVIAMAGLTGDDVAQLHQIRSAANSTPVLDLEAVAFSQSFLTTAGNDALGFVGQTPSDPKRKTAAAAHLRSIYSAKFHTDVIPDPTAFTYEAVIGVARAMESGPSDRTQLGAAIHNVQLADTGVGPLRFDPSGARLGGTLWYFHVANGAFVFDTGYRQTAPLAVHEVPLEE